MEDPTPDLQKLHAYLEVKDQKVQVEIQNLLLRNTTLQTDTAVLAVILYAGHDTKIMQN